MENQNDNELARRCRELLDDPELRRAELARTMAQHPTLTRAGLVWHMGWGAVWTARHDLPQNLREQEEYDRQRARLVREILTDEESQREKEPEENGLDGNGLDGIEHGEIPLALMYLEICRHSRSSGRSGNSRNGKAISYGLKHSAERLGPSPHYIANGSMIAAALMTGCRTEQRTEYEMLSLNADIHILEPRECGDGWAGQDAGCGARIDAGTGGRLCDDCRSARAARAARQNAR